MKIGITGATGFIGRYIVKRLCAAHDLRCWRRTTSDVQGLETANIQWVEGSLSNQSSIVSLASDCQAIVHAALWKPGKTFRGGEGDVARFAEVNIIGTLNLIRAAIDNGVRRFVFLSTCAVHEIILDDRALDEAHPLWATSHYGAHKAAIEKFVHSYGLGEGYEICALRPTGVYGVAHPIDQSKWFELVKNVVSGTNVRVSRGGKEVHAGDVANAVELLLTADAVAGQAYNCYDRYVSEYEVATLTRNHCNSTSTISGESKDPKHQIDTSKIRRLGMTFGGSELLERTIGEMIAGCR